MNYELSIHLSHVIITRRKDISLVIYLVYIYHMLSLLDVKTYHINYIHITLLIVLYIYNVINNTKIITLYNNNKCN